MQLISITDFLDLRRLYILDIKYLRALNDLQIKVIGQKEINVQLSALPRILIRVTFQIINNDNWFIHLVLIFCLEMI